MAGETNWVRSLLGQRLYIDGEEVLPTKKEWNFVGLDAAYNSQTDQIDIFATGSGDWQESVRLASTTNFAATRVGNVLTASSNGALSIDGVTVADADRILIKDQTLGADNGIYVVSDTGSPTTPAVLTRAILADETGEVTSGLTVYVAAGTQHAGQLWALSTPDPIVLNSTTLTFEQTGTSSIIGNVGAFDNRIVRSDGTGGDTLQGSTATLDDAGNLSLASIALGSDPATTGTVKLSNTDIISSKRAGAGSDLTVARITSADVLELGQSASGLVGVRIEAPTGSVIESRINSAPVLTIAGTSVSIAQPTAFPIGGGTVAASGDVRLRNTGNIAARNAGNTADVAVAAIDGANNVVLGDGTNAAAAFLSGSTTINLRVGATARFIVSGTTSRVVDALEVNTAGGAVSATGDIRIRNTGTLNGRNAANNGDIAMLNLDGSNVVQVGDSTLGNARFSSGGTTLRAAAATVATFTATAATIVPDVRIGTNPAQQGPIGIPVNTIIYARNAANTNDNRLIGSDGSDQILVGRGDGSNFIMAASTLTMRNTTTSLLTLDATNLRPLVVNLSWGKDVVAPRITQADETVSSTNGDTFLIKAQNATGATSNGGDLDLQPGTGTSVHGTVRMRDAAGTERLRVNGSGDVLMAAASVWDVSTAGVLRMRCTGGTWTMRNNAILEWNPTETVNPIIRHADDTNASVTGDPLLVHAQNTTGSGTCVGGSITLRGGNSTGTSTNNTGGAAILLGGAASGASVSSIGGDAIVRPGAGVEGHGASKIQDKDATTRIEVNATGIGFFAATPASQQTSGANLTNNVTSGGTNDVIDNWTDLTTYSTDAAAIRNAVYQLARKLKQVNDGLRTLGLLT